MHVDHACGIHVQCMFNACRCDMHATIHGAFMLIACFIKTCMACACTCMHVRNIACCIHVLHALCMTTCCMHLCNMHFACNWYALHNYYI